MNYTNEDIEALAGLATSKNSKDWDLFNQYPADIKLKTIDGIMSIINKKQCTMNHKISNSVVRTDLALGLSIDFDFHSCITFIELRKFNLLVQVFEDNVTSAMERIYIELLKIITND